MAAKKKAGKAADPAKPAPGEKHVGTVEHYYPKVQAAAVKLDADLKVGDTIHIQGHSDDRTQKVKSMQLDHKQIEEAHKGESVGIQVPVKVHENSEVLKVVKPAAPAPKAAKKAAKKPKKAKKAKKAKTAKKAKRPAKRAKKAKRAKNAKKARKKVARRARKSASSRRRAGKRPKRGKR